MKHTRKWQLQRLDCIHLESIGVCLGGQIQILFHWITKYLLWSSEPWVFVSKFWMRGIARSNFSPLMNPIVSLDSQLSQSVTPLQVSFQPRAIAGTTSHQSPFPPIFHDVVGWTVWNNRRSLSLRSHLTTDCVWRVGGLEGGPQSGAVWLAVSIRSSPFLRTVNCTSVHSPPLFENINVLLSALENSAFMAMAK